MWISPRPAKLLRFNSATKNSLARRMSFDRTVAHFVTHRRRLVFSFVALIVLVCAATIVFALHFDSDILDMLPREFDSVQALKTSDREFTNARQLTFAVWDQTHTLDAVALDD